MSQTVPLYEPTFTSVAAHVAFDEALLVAAEAGTHGEALGWWTWPEYAVVVGANGILREEVNLAACARDGVPVVRRASGGGTVLLGPGCVQFSLLLRYERAAELRDVGASYRWILEPFGAAIDRTTTLQGSSDLCLGPRKFSGNAQQRKTHYVLHHGTLLYDFDLAMIERYLPLPPRMPDYRSARPHTDFLANVPCPLATLRQAFLAAWPTATPTAVPPDIADAVARLVAEKYSQPSWLERR